MKLEMDRLEEPTAELNKATDIAPPVLYPNLAQVYGEGIAVPAYALVRGDTRSDAAKRVRW